MPEVLPSVVVLTTMAVFALWLTISRGGVSADAAAVRSAVWAAVIAVAAQAGHFFEELTTGLHERLPAAFGLPPMSLRLFVARRESVRTIDSQTSGLDMRGNDAAGH